MIDGATQLDAFNTPGLLLKAARERQGYSEREAADRLNLMPDYVGIIERDEYQALRSPSFARGYVRAYCRLLELDESLLLSLFDELQGSSSEVTKRIETQSLQLHRTGKGVVIGLGILFLLVLALWWWGNESAAEPAPAVSKLSMYPVDAASRVAGDST